MISSMTGFASAKGSLGAHAWGWELRSVNGKGLDLRLRVPDWLEGLEAALRAELSRAVTRGNVTLNLKVARDDSQAALTLNEAALDTALTALARIDDIAAARGVALAPSRASDLLALRGMMDSSAEEDDVAALVAQFKAEFPPLLAQLVDMRRVEGRALADILTTQLCHHESPRP